MEAQNLNLPFSRMLIVLQDGPVAFECFLYVSSICLIIYI